MSTRRSTDIYQQKFQTEYARLNPEQRQAVDTIEGPVMVIAGAGTGKTQTIALRIANILDKTQTPPSSILCLTFTDSAANNMRSRLLEIIGPSAYSVQVHTFHSFCNDVIQTHPDFFVFAKNIQSLEDIDKIQLVSGLIDKLPHEALLKPWGDPYYYQSSIISAIQTLKRENVTPNDLLARLQAISQFLDKSQQLRLSLKSLRASKALESEVKAILAGLQKISDIPPVIAARLSLFLTFYQSGIFDQGPAKTPSVNFKNALIKFLDGLEKDLPKQLELQKLYLSYQKALRKKGFYDFDDMILFALNAFLDHPELLSEYQEKYQYILVDEYQDTNSAQNQIIDLLGSYFDVPNIFVVGDDDQSIFRFQGAAIENIYDFYQRHRPNLQLIVLKNNYRSHQLILDSSQSVINYNQNRIAAYIKDIDKSLVSAKNFDADPINLFAARTSQQEDAWVGETINRLLAQGTQGNDIAVLYRNNADVVDLIETLERQGIQYYLAAGDDVLQNPQIRQLIKLLRFLSLPTADDLLFQVLASDFFKLDSFDLYKILRFRHVHKYPLIDICSDPELQGQINPPLKVATRKKLKNLMLRTAKATKWQANYSLDRFFNQVIRRFGYLSYLLSADDLLSIIHLNTLYSEIKRLSRTSNLNLEQLLNRLDLYIDNGISLAPPSSLKDTDKAIRLMTVHKAKGLEFSHVFLYKCIDKKWGNSAHYSSLNLPPGILKTELLRLAADENEEERRLFYVALTRAKKQIYISYSQKSPTDREQLPSAFISEIDRHLIQPVKVASDHHLTCLKASFAPPPKIDDASFRRHLRHHLLTGYKFNVTHLNSYLRCPFCFYYKTILRIPRVRDKFSSLGSAVHESLSYLFDTYRRERQTLTKEELLIHFKKTLRSQGLDRSRFSPAFKQGKQILSRYYDHHLDEVSNPCLTDYDFSTRSLYLDNIPLTGKIDKIDILDKKIGGKNLVNLIDFKTGNPDSKYKELGPDGDYFRQLVFYQILAQLDSDFPYQVNDVIIDFVQESRNRHTFVKKAYHLTDNDIAPVKALIKEIYKHILDLDFFHLGDNCADHDDLHHFFPSSS